MPTSNPAVICRAISDGVIMIDQGGIITFANRAATNILGYAPEELIGQPVHDVLHAGIARCSSSSPADCSACIVLNDGSAHWSVSGKFRRKDGTAVPVEYNVVPASGDAQGEGAVVAFRDVSALELMKQEQKRLRAIIDETPAFISTADREGNITYFNKTGRSWLGMSEDEPIKNRRLAEESLRIARQAIQNGLWQGYRDGFLKRRLPEPRDLSVFQTVVAHKNARGEVDFFSTIAIDITEQKRWERESARLLAIIEDTPDFVVTADVHKRLFYCNKAARRMLGVRDDEDISSMYISDTHPEWAARLVLEEGLPTAARDGVWEGETAVVSRDGREIPVWQVLVAHKTTSGEVEYYSTIARDITERKRLEKRLAYLAGHDSLTGVLNRARFQEKLQDELDRSLRTGTAGALLFLDLDNFKDVNDSLGHQAGDDILQRIARILRDHLRAGDVLGRLGGDEFAILLPGATASEAKQVGERLLTLLEDEVVCCLERTVRIRASMGGATYPEDADNVKDLLINADLSMYAAKRAGGGRVLLCNNEHGRNLAKSRLEWEHKCRSALQNDGFVLHRQPLIDLRTRQVVAWELLLRMKDDDGTLIMPGKFLPTCERSELIHALDRWVMNEAFRLLADWKELRDDSAAVHVNLSRRTVSNEQLVDFVQELLRETRINPRRVVFELTETAAIEDVHGASRFMNEMQKLGFRFALDDFGVGFSTFGALRRLPVHYLKIDGSFIRDIRTDPVSRHLVRAIIEVARGLGKRTVAEFIPDEETMDILLEAGVDYGQGYYIGKPEPIPQADKLRPDGAREVG